MKKLRITTKSEDGNGHPQNGNNLGQESHIIPETSQYAFIEREIDLYLKDEETAHFRNTLLKVHKEFIDTEIEPVSQKVKPFFRKGYVFAIAASIAVIIGVFGVTRLFYNSSVTNFDDIFSQYYKTYQDDFSNRSDQLVVNNFYMAFQAYENRDFEKAVELFSKVTEADGSILMAYFYKGISSIEIGNYAVAVESFEKVLKNTSNPYYPQAQWYSALTWLKLNNSENAKQHLSWLIKNDRFYGTKAKEVLLKIEK
jgi:tetratricopeptide (TPR) repeat protein